jgi:hypothetical protein
LFTATVIGDAMNDELRDGYLSEVGARLASAGYEPWSGNAPGVGESRIYHRRKAQVARLALVDTFCVVRCQDEEVTVSDFTDLSGSAFAFAIANKSWLPRGLLGMAIAHGVMVTGKATPALAKAVETYAPRHWASMEFPVLVELDAKQLRYFGGTPVWGAAYYRGLRTQTKDLFGPK